MSKCYKCSAQKLEFLNMIEQLNTARAKLLLAILGLKIAGLNAAVEFTSSSPGPKQKHIKMQIWLTPFPPNYEGESLRDSEEFVPDIATPVETTKKWIPIVGQDVVFIDTREQP